MSKYRVKEWKAIGFSFCAIITGIKTDALNKQWQPGVSRAAFPVPLQISLSLFLSFPLPFRSIFACFSPRSSIQTSDPPCFFIHSPLFLYSTAELSLSLSPHSAWLSNGLAIAEGTLRAGLNLRSLDLNLWRVFVNGAWRVYRSRSERGCLFQMFVSNEYAREMSF